MKVHKLGAAMLILLPFIGSPAVGNALDLHVVINGTTVNCPSGSLTCNIAGTYGNVEVTGYPSDQTPQVVAVDDAQLPLIKLVNAKFKATASAVNGAVTFWATFGGRQGPMMLRRADGWLVRVEGSQAPYSGTTNRGEFIVDGVVISTSLTPNTESIDGVQNGGDTSGSKKVVMALPFSYGKIDGNIFTKTETMSALSGSRDLKGEFTFYLPLANDYLRLTEVKIETRDPGRDEVSGIIGYCDLPEDGKKECKCERPSLPHGVKAKCELQITID